MLPELALSIRQPWAFAVVMGWKPVENRSWRKPNPGLMFRGPVAIHASCGMTRKEYETANNLFDYMGFECPPPHELRRGAIIGAATVIDVVKAHDSSWFFGPRALVLTNACPIEPIPCDGQLGFFKWYPAERDLISPAKWMLPEKYAETKQCEQGQLI